MALSHARPGQVIDISPLGDALAQSATHAIVKTQALELIRVVLHEGQTLPPHKVYGEMTLLCIEGAVDVDVAGSACELRAGQVILFPAQAEYAVRARRDSSLLMTVQTPPGLPGSGSSTVKPPFGADRP